MQEDLLKEVKTQAFEQAHLALARGEVPVGAVIVDIVSGEIVSVAHNQVERRKDPLAHAEMLAIKEALEKKGTKFLQNCSLYVTLEPCAMCATAIAFVRLQSLFFGAYDKKSGGVEHGPEIFNQSTIHHAPEVYGGIGEEESAQLLKIFFQNKRK